MKLGAHESVAGGIFKAIELAVRDECESLQVFVKSPNRWAAPELTPKDIQKYKELSAQFGVNNVAAHAAYLINLASTKTDVRDKSLICIKDELKRCDDLGIPYYVMHPGSSLDSDFNTGLLKICDGINDIYRDGEYRAMLLVESTSGMGNTIGGRLEHLQQICECVDCPDKVGVCLDTCHMYSAGYDIAGDYDTVMDEVFTRFGDKLKVFHLNDTKFGLGSRKDRHELIGRGFIGAEAFRLLVNDTRLSDVLGILETPVAANETYMDEVRLLKSFRGI